jgi:hypothetical protein
MTSAAQVDAVAPSSAVAMRKLLLKRRASRLFAQESFLATWSNFFPQHDPITMRFIGAKSKAKSYWNDPNWKKAAQAYHRDRQGRTLVVEQRHSKQSRLPTPAVTVEAIWLAIRERGLAALEEPATKGRYDNCDEAARTELQRRLANNA